MKKSFALLLLLGLSFGLASCETTPSSSQASSSESQETISDLEKSIREMRKGFALTGTITQSRRQCTVDINGNLIPTGPIESNVYYSDFTFDSNHGDKAFERASWQEVMSEVVYMEDVKVFRTEEGYVYTQSLDHTNSVIDQVTYTNGHPSAFDVNGYYNFFEVLNEEDFQIDESGLIANLNSQKANFISSSLLSYMNNGFYGNTKSFTFNLDNNSNFIGMDIIMNDKIVLDTPDGTQYYYYLISNKAQFNIFDQGTAEVKKLQPLSSKVENEPLTNAFSHVDKNMTLIVSDTSRSMDGSITGTTYQKLFFDNDEIYVHAWDNKKGSEDTLTSDDFLLRADEISQLLYSYKYDEASKDYVKSKVTNFPSAYQGIYTYENLLPIVSNVSADLFTYNPLTNTYDGEELALSALVSCFNITKAPFRLSHIQNANKVSVRIDAAGELEYVEFSYAYLSDSGIENGEVRITYNDVGYTELPR